MEILSNNKPYEVIVVDNGNTQEVVTVRPVQEKPTQVFVPLPYKPVIIKEVDTNGNTITKTNDVTYIESQEELQIIVMKSRAKREKLLHGRLTRLLRSITERQKE